MDRFSFLQFLGLQASDNVLDARTIWDFKQLLEKDERDGSRRLFGRFERQLQDEGLLAREGSIVDASFVAAPRQGNSREQNARIKGRRAARRLRSGHAEGSAEGMRCALDEEKQRNALRL
ncbi:MAG: transposase [Puniceicoccaceae bacterium]|nr:MAG: transposase [Puniceicoccaceae bacterium]